MKKISITSDLTGFAYDTNQPNLQNEQLAYLIKQQIDNLATAGYQILQTEVSDVLSVDSLIGGIFGNFANQENGGEAVAWTNLSSSDTLLDPMLAQQSIQARTAIYKASEDREQGQEQPEGQDYHADFEAMNTNFGNMVIELQNSLEKIEEAVELIHAMIAQEPVIIIGDSMMYLKSQVYEVDP